MTDSGVAPRLPRTFPWLLVLSLVGLDYFSTLAYLPSIAVSAAGPLAPLAALGVSLITLLAAVPVYCYVVGRSPAGEGATGLLNRVVRGWFGKFLILILLGFVATDFVITRTLSVADASLHILHNPVWRGQVAWVQQNREALRASFPTYLQGGFFDFWNEQLVLTVVLSMIGFAFYAFLQTDLTRAFLRLAAGVVVLYLTMTAAVLALGVAHLVEHPEHVEQWWASVRDLPAAQRGGAGFGALLLTMLYFFPKVALGLSGFELSMAVTPLVEGQADDDPARPRGRIRNTRKLITLAALVMSVLVPATTCVVTLLVPPEALLGEGRAAHRALAYLAHGEEHTEAYSSLFGAAFGTAYDLSAAMILCLAGASAVLGIRDLVPGVLARFGMQLEWARRIGLITHLFNLTILIVTVFFQASVAAQQQAYATSVLVMLTSAAVAAALDVRHRLVGRAWRRLAALPFLGLALFFLAMAAFVVVANADGLGIAFTFVGIVLSTSLVSRYIRNRELRFQGFQFTDEATRLRWDEMRRYEFQVLVAHRPGRTTLVSKEEEVRARHRLDPDVPIVFIEAELGDASDFYQRPMMRIERKEGREVIHVWRCASIPHVLAAVGLEFAKVGRPPEIIFGWSNEGPVAAMLHFLFLGQGNVPWMTHELLRHAEPNTEKQPRVSIG